MDNDRAQNIQCAMRYWRGTSNGRNPLLGKNVMNRSDLISRLAELQPQLQIKDSQLAVKVIIDALCDTLSNGGRVEIRGFGSFALHYKPSRMVRNPKTGGKLQVRSKYVPHFKAGKGLRERVHSD